MVSVASLAHRRLRSRVSSYHDVRDEPGLVGRRAIGHVDVIGYYENPQGRLPPIVIISESGLAFDSEGGIERVDYASVRGIQGPDPQDPSDTIVLDVDNRDPIEIVIAGRAGKYRDIYAMWTFLLRTVELRRGDRHRS